MFFARSTCIGISSDQPETAAATRIRSGNTPIEVDQYPSWGHLKLRHEEPRQMISVVLGMSNNRETMREIPIGIDNRRDLR